MAEEVKFNEPSKSQTDAVGHEPMEFDLADSQPDISTDNKDSPKASPALEDQAIDDPNDLLNDSGVIAQEDNPDIETNLPLPVSDTSQNTDNSQASSKEEVTSKESGVVDEFKAVDEEENVIADDTPEDVKDKKVIDTDVLSVEEVNEADGNTKDEQEDTINSSELTSLEDDEEQDKTVKSPSLGDENSTSDPIEEVDPSNKDETEPEEAPDLAAADPLMKDTDSQADDFGDDTAPIDEKPDLISDRIMLSVKPPGELMENFVDVANEDSLPSESMDFDPIAEEDGSNDANEGEGELFNGKEAETILAEDDSEAAVEPICKDDDKIDEYVIMLGTKTEKEPCSICNQEEVPKYLALKNSVSTNICTPACLEKFKEQNVDNYKEMFLKLRVFATEEPTLAVEEVPAVDYLEGERVESGAEDPFRRCAACTTFIDVENYFTWEAQDYCNEGCLYDIQSDINSHCAKCVTEVPGHLLGKYCVRFGITVSQFCKTACLIAYKKARKLCHHCQEDLKNDETSMYCSKRCKDTSLPGESEPKESSLCSVCGQIKEVELKVRDAAKMDCICSDRCFVAYKFVNKIELVKCEVCPTTFERKPGDQSVYEIGTVYNLCSKECQKIFLIGHRKIVNCVICLVKKYDFDMIRFIKGQQIACLCSLHCLNIHFESEYTQKSKSFHPNIRILENIANDYSFLYEKKSLREIVDGSANAGKVGVQKIMVIRPRSIPRQKNKAIMCRSRMLTKAIQCKPRERSIYIQTEDTTTRWVPIPVPIFVPMPLHLFVQPVPMLTPIPIPLLIPIFVLTGRKSIKGIQKEIAKIKSRIPADPLEAEILMMADMAAGDKRNEPTSDSDDDTTKMLVDTSIVQMETSASTSFSDDVLSMAFKMANEYSEPLDLESEVDNSSRMLAAGRRPPQIYKPRGRPQRVMEMTKPDENLSLKYTYGVSAWKQWATIKNLELQKMKNPKFVKLDLLQLSAEDLCFCLCQFVKELRKPNGAPYASDTIYYLCLGIQLYLYENGRIDNLFCDPYYEKFTDTLNEVCLQFCQVYNENQYIVTRVEEEHLWESKQLGAHSPLVLLNTLLFFNTKHFNLTTVEEHLQLSFSHIMKHWKRNTNAPNQRNVLLRFYPPSKGAWGKRKVYEQQECLENPLRCPVRLYEFFLSKCPESVKTRNDVFYLQPERSCVPDSPVWYSTSALHRIHLEKMLNRMKMIKEISMAILGT